MNFGLSISIKYCAKKMLCGTSFVPIFVLTISLINMDDFFSYDVMGRVSSFPNQHGRFFSYDFMGRVSNLPSSSALERFSPLDASFIFYFFGVRKCHSVVFTKTPMICFYFYTFVTRRFGTLFKICHIIELYDVSLFVVPKRNIIPYTKVVKEGLIILECVKLWRPLLVPANELQINEGKAIGVFKVRRCEGKDKRFFGYFITIIEVITSTLLISLNCKLT